ncbi:LysR family transcriptional regulator [Sorangium cellulosum]|uniref:LysR family transcriptional regulator n=2 Tax=Sorangium cellulosum TaxID=56 RepID=A0A2L0EHT9_SORCE|nr:LysR family transcriptional regulator [Sorangium cellulosum]
MNEADLLLFLQIAQQPSLSAVARASRLSVAVVSHRLAAFESRLGVRLFHRSTRKLALTEDGRAFLPHAEALVEAMTTARGALGSPDKPLSGVLRVTASASFGRMHLTSVLAAFLDRHPGLSVDLHLSDSVVDLLENRYELGIRISERLAPGLIARRLTPDRRFLCASPAYLERAGVPRHPDDLLRHECVVLHDQRDWRFRMPDGSVHTVKVGGRFRCNNGEATREAAVAGLGITLKSQWNCYMEIAARRLVPVLEEYPLEHDIAIWAVYPSARQLAPRVRAFIDFLATAWTKPPWEQGGAAREAQPKPVPSGGAPLTRAPAGTGDARPNPPGKGSRARTRAAG